MAAAAAAALASSSSSNKGKQVICISSSSSGDEEDEESAEEEEASESEPQSEDETEEIDTVSDDENELSDGGDDDISDYDENESSDGGDDDDDDSKGKPTDEEHCNKIIDLLRGRKSLIALKLDECKAYLRKHELRISGTKEICIKRIQEHWRIKDGNGEKLYPESTFVINCTGDVCRGDVVLFKQRVYEKFDIVKRGGGAKLIGKRVIAGRVVNESYGSAKQQHTFSIEVLWSKGVKPLPPLFPLLVKGRNLYRLKTFRQSWSNEAERSRVLAEKHNRGTAARHIRAIARAMVGNKGSKRKKKSSRTKAPPNKKRKEDLEIATGKKQNCAKRSSNGHANVTKVAKTGDSVSAARLGDGKMREAAKPRNSRPTAAHGCQNMREVAKTRNSKSSATYPEQPSYHPNGIHREDPYLQRYSYYNYNHTPIEVLHRNNIGIPQANRVMHHIPSYNMGHTSSAAGVPPGYMPHAYNMGYPPSAHDQILYRSSYTSHPRGSTAFQQGRRKPIAYNDWDPNGQFHGWRP